MAIPILNHMDFQKCGEIRNVLLHATGSGDVTSPGTGQIIYDSGSVKYYNGSGWVTLGTGSGSGWALGPHRTCGHIQTAVRGRIRPPRGVGWGSEAGVRGVRRVRRSRWLRRKVSLIHRVVDSLSR